MQNQFLVHERSPSNFKFLATNMLTLQKLHINYKKDQKSICCLILTLFVMRFIQYFSDHSNCQLYNIPKLDSKSILQRKKNTLQPFLSLSLSISEVSNSLGLKLPLLIKPLKNHLVVRL